MRHLAHAKLAEIARTHPVEWEPAPHSSTTWGITDDDRYGGVRSVWAIEGDAFQQLRAYQAESEKNVHPTAWDKILWDDPLERPEDTKGPPLIIVQSFDAFDFLVGPQGPRRGAAELIFPLGYALHKIIYSLDVDLGAYTETWQSFSDTVCYSQAVPVLHADPSTYAHEVQEVMQAAMNVKTLWFNFLDQAVLAAMEGFKLPSPPVFVFLYVDMHLATVADTERISRILQKMAHPRLLCLFAKDGRDVRQPRLGRPPRSTR